VTWEGDGWNFALLPARDRLTLLLTTEGFRETAGRIHARSASEQNGTDLALLRAARTRRAVHAYRVEGPTGALHQFDAQKVLLDPFAEEVFFPPDFSRAAAMKPGANDGLASLGVLPVKKPTTGKCAAPASVARDCHL
jgi:pullulanase/glycogen debranching enzyme